MKRRAILVCAFSICALALPGCSEDEDNGMEPDSGGKPPAEMVDEWTYQSVTIDAAPADLATVLEWVPNTVEARVQIQANSAYVYQEVNSMGGQLWFESGFVFIDGDEIDVNAQLDSDGPLDETTRFGFTLNGDMLTLSLNEGGSLVVFELAR